MKDRVFGVVVTYRPREDVLDNICTISKQVDHLIVVQNEYLEESSRALQSLLDKKNTTIIFNMNNEGVARAINQGLRLGIDQGADFFILFDQDSSPKEGMVHKLKNAYSNVDRLCMCGPLLEDRKSGALDLKSERSDVFEVDLLITSGSFFSKRVVENIGMMDESLFIDYVDHDYCLRLKQAGGTLERVSGARMLHSFGEAETKKCFGKTFFMHSYSPIRRYYMARNRVIIYCRYPQLGSKWMRNDILFWLKDYVKLIFFEKNRIGKVLSILKGLWDGIIFVLKQQDKKLANKLSIP